jgi:predicted nucleic acid-binding protein
MKEAHTLMSTLGYVIDSLVKIRISSAARALEIAADHKITYYDAAYIEAAIESNATLVTDDGRLFEVGRKYVHTLNSDDS